MSRTVGEFDVAIIGMAGRFPGAPTLDAFWHNLAGGVESITRLSDDEILASGVPASQLNDRRYVKAAPVLDEPGHFDAGFFGFSPLEARSLDPQHRLLLELAHEALETAGYDPGRYAGRIGVFAGAALNTYFLNVGLHRQLAEDYIPTLIGNDKDFLATRVSYKLDLRGPSVTVQTACSTSMVALHLACQSLLSEESDMALAGAVSVRVPHRAGYLCDGGGVVSPDGHVRAFDARANGTVFGSGGGVLVVKRLADALADGDTIRAVVKGTAVNNDGAAKAGYTAPSVDSQADVVVEALANAGVDADSIGYVEAHGSGTPVGDPIELRALTKAFRASTQRSGYCAIGSVKTNIGHLDAAAAVAGIIKTVLALEHRRLPPSLNFTEANEEIAFARTPFHVNTDLRDWTGNGPRRAGVMSTGMGGTNAHVVLEEPPVVERAAAARPPHLLLFSAKSEAALDRATRRLADFLRANEDVDMGDVAHTLRVGRRAFAHRRSLVCASREDAIAALSEGGPKRIASGTAPETRRPVVLLLPGAGDHYVGMGYDLYEAWPAFRNEVDRCAEMLEPHLETDIRSILYPESRSWKTRAGVKGIDLRKMLGRGSEAADDPDTAALDRTLFAQPALFTIAYATARLWQSLGITPDAIVGHSLGEYVAACLAGVMSLEDALRLIAVRARLVEPLPQGAMLAVTLAEEELRPLLPPDLSISLVNGPELCVVAGPPEAVDRFERLLDGKDIIVRRVRNAHAFHSRMLDPIVPELEDAVRAVALHAPAVPYVSNVSGTWVTASQATDPAYWARHATQTARFTDALGELWQFTHPILLEAGPGRTLSVLAMQHPGRQRGGDPVTVSSLRHVYENQSDVEYLWHGAGKLWLAGAELDWEALPSTGSSRRIPLPTYPFERERHWLAATDAARGDDVGRFVELNPPASAEARSSAVVQKNPDPGQWLYAPSWKRVLPRRAAAGAPARWLVFDDENGCAADLVSSLESGGHDVVVVRAGGEFVRHDARAYTIDPAEAQHYEALMRALESTPDRIVHAWNVADLPGDLAGDRFARAQERGFHSLLCLARSLAAHSAQREVRLFVLSSGVHEVSGTESLCPEKATLLGPCMSIGQEYPDVRVTNIDVDPPNRTGPRAATDLILGEVTDPDASPFVALRNGHRWVQAYEPAAAPDADGRRAVLRRRGVYLITGGLGGIGIALSRYLAATYEARLVLVGRSQLPPRESWKDWIDGHPADDPVRARIEAIGSIERAGGEVLYLDANVADEDAMRGVLARAHERFGALHGVIHAAGVVGDHREIEDSDPAGCEPHFQAKAHGVHVLAKVLDGHRPDFCLLMSSLSAILGGIGQAAYASSNLYLDAFARRHNRTSTAPWLSVNWDVWRLHEGEDASTGLGTTLRELGMDPEEAMATLESVLARRDAGQLVVSTGNLDARIAQWVRLESLHGRPAGAASSTPLARPPAADAADGDIELAVARIWQDALGVESVGLHDGFAELGGHSLLAVRIVSELRRRFQVDLPVRILFDAPTVGELSRAIEERLVADIDALTDDEARKLVSRS